MAAFHPRFPARCAQQAGLWVLCAVLTGVLWPQRVLAVPPEALIEVQTAEQTCIGKIVAHNDQICWLMQEDGQLKRLKLTDVTTFRQLSARFQPLSAAEVRTRLQNELGRTFDIKGSTHYLIAAAPGHAGQYIELLEQMYREFSVYLSARRFPAQPVEFPLVVILFPTQQEFVDYAKADGIQNTTGLQGYYDVRTNRIAAYDPATTVSDQSPRQSQTSATLASRTNQQNDLQETLMHEATHQIAFNLGLHSRIGTNPRWVVEGLAMVFEHPEARSASKSSAARERINRERYVWFGSYAKSRRTASSLEELIAGEQPFVTATLDAYSEAWSLTFFLMETRSSDYARYLATMAQRSPLEPYRPEERLNDFRTAFGQDLQRLEIDYLRFLDRL